MKRKVIQVYETANLTVALCDDGAMFRLAKTGGPGTGWAYSWHSLPAIPQPTLDEILRNEPQAYREGYMVGANASIIPCPYNGERGGVDERAKYADWWRGKTEGADSRKGR